MIWFAIAFFVLWLIGAFVMHLGAWVHLLLLVAVVLTLAHFIGLPRFDG